MPRSAFKKKKTKLLRFFLAGYEAAATDTGTFDSTLDYFHRSIVATRKEVDPKSKKAKKRHRRWFNQFVKRVHERQGG